MKNNIGGGVDVSEAGGLVTLSTTTENIVLSKEAQIKLIEYIIRIRNQNGPTNHAAGSKRTAGWDYSKDAANPQNWNRLFS